MVLIKALNKVPVQSLQEDEFGVIDHDTFAKPWEEPWEAIGGGCVLQRTRKRKTGAFIKRLAFLWLVFSF